MVSLPCVLYSDSLKVVCSQESLTTSLYGTEDTNVVSALPCSSQLLQPLVPSEDCWQLLLAR